VASIDGENDGELRLRVGFDIWAIRTKRKKAVVLDRKSPPFLQTARKGWGTLNNN
jgi:hypothetical protein